MPNDTNSSSKTIVYAPHPETVWYWSLRGIIAVVAVLGNGMVIWLIASRRKLWTRPNCFVLSLLLADFCTGAVNTPLEFSCTVLWSCDMWLVQAIKDVFLVSSVFNLCAMTVDRYIAVVHSLKYPRLLSKTNCICVITTAWVLGVTIPVIFLATFRLRALQTYRIISIFRLLFTNALPMAGLVAAYFKMLSISRGHRRKVGQQQRQVNFNYLSTNTTARSENSSSVRVIGSMVVFFVFCYSFTFYRVLSSYVLFTQVPKIIVPISRLLQYLNSALDFLVYALFKKDIKIAATRVLCTSRSVIDN